MCQEVNKYKIGVTRVSESIETSFCPAAREQQVVVDIAYQCNKPHGRGILWAFAPPFEGGVYSMQHTLVAHVSYQPNQHALAAQFKSVFHPLSLSLTLFFILYTHTKFQRKLFWGIKWPRVTTHFPVPCEFITKIWNIREANNFTENSIPSCLLLLCNIYPFAF